MKKAVSMSRVVRRIQEQLRPMGIEVPPEHIETFLNETPTAYAWFKSARAYRPGHLLSGLEMGGGKRA